MQLKIRSLVMMFCLLIPLVAGLATAQSIVAGEAVSGFDGSGLSFDGSGLSIEESAAKISGQTTDVFLYMPIVFMPVPAPVLNPIEGPTATESDWTATWNVPAPEVTAYQVQEANSADFINPVQYEVGDTTSQTFSYGASFNNYYCYRVRALAGTSIGYWSNTECTTGNYLDHFSDSGSGWAIRQQDSDDTDNSSYYENDQFVIKIGGRWDYALASPLAKAPEPPYVLETRVSFDPGVDNLHGYGVVFGGNRNGQACTATNIGNCFTQYYRLLVIWYGPPNSFRIQLKRIDYNDPMDNLGRGVSLVDYRDIYVGDSKGFNNWRIEVHENGSILIFLNGGLVASAVDTNYINNPYFGVMAASNEYLGAEPHFEWYRVRRQ